MYIHKGRFKSHLPNYAIPDHNFRALLQPFHTTDGSPQLQRTKDHPLPSQDSGAPPCTCLQFPFSFSTALCSISSPLLSIPSLTLISSKSRKKCGRVLDQNKQIQRKHAADSASCSASGNQLDAPSGCLLAVNVMHGCM